MAKINEYRCTRSSRWVGGKPGNEVSPEDRLGYFIRAEDGDEALGIMLARFPDEDLTVELSRENVGALSFAENPSKAATIPSAEIAQGKQVEEMKVQCIECGKIYIAEGWDPMGGDCPNVRDLETGELITPESEEVGA